MQDKESYIGQLYTTHCQELKRFVCIKFGLNTAEAEDLVHASFAKFYTVAGFMDIANPRAYLFRIAQNLVVDQKRAQGRQAALLGDRVDDIGASDSASHSALHTTLHDPARIHCARQRLGIIESVVQKMSDKRREILRLSRYEHLSNVEIAKRMGVSETAIRKHLSRALLDIKHAMDSLGPEVE